MFGWKPMVGVVSALLSAFLSAFLPCAVVCASGLHLHAEKNAVVCVPFSQPLH